MSLAWCLLALAAAAHHPIAVVHPSVDRLLQSEGSVAVWVMFTDKGSASPEERQLAFADLLINMDERTLRRRALRRSAAGLFDDRDLPVCERYIDAVLSSGADRRAISRWINAISVNATRRQIEQIAALPFVRAIQPVRRGRALDATPIRDVRTAASALDGAFHGMAEEQLAQVAITDMHDAGFTGGGMVIGVLDTGFLLTHEAFNQPANPLDVIAEWDFVNDDPVTGPEPGDPGSQHWHGSIVLGTIGAYLPNTYVGGAYEASFILCKTEDISDEYPAEEDYYVAGLEFIESHGGDVATSSLGYYDWYEYFDMNGVTAVTTLGVNAATDNGLVCCTAVGNRGRRSDFPSLIAPSDAFDVLSCGAVDSSGDLAGFSSDGPTADGRIKPEVLARGVSTASVDPDTSSDYLTASGTSLSTPLVASATTLLMQAHPNWTIAELRRALFETADYYVANGMPDPESHRGYGVINVADAADYRHPGDLNCDAAIDAFDIEPFIAALVDPQGYEIAWPDCDIDLADMNRDGAVDAFDVEPFIARLLE